MKIYGVILAGGSGTRFWPLSRKKRPKQLLNLTGREIMINEAIDRLAHITEYENIFVITNEDQADQVRQVTDGRVMPSHVLAEPCARNTAPCIGYAAMELLKKNGDGIMVITPSDAYIQSENLFVDTLQKAINAAYSGYLVTVGITPTFAATGYGYIKYDKSTPDDAKQVFEFREKPDTDTAERYLKSEEYVWNSGMFIWKASSILQQYQRFLPEMYLELQRIGNYIGSEQESDIIKTIYPKFQKISIDYGIMEPAAQDNNVLVVPGTFGWNDVGSWDMLRMLHDEDECGNICIGDIVVSDTKNTVAYSSGKLVSLIGVSDLVVVETNDAIMVCHKDYVQDVGKFTEILAMNERSNFL